MPFKVEVGPPQIAIHHAQTVLITDPDGQVNWPSDKGLYFLDTRMISAMAISANGEPWDLLNGGAITADTARIHLTNRAFLSEDGAVQARTLGLVIGRKLGGGMHEDLDITNHGRRPVKFNLEIAIRSDFADVFEVKQNRIVRRGRIATDWSDEHQKLRTTYSNQDFIRAVHIGTRNGDHPAAYANGRLSFELRIDAGQTWHCCLLYDLIDGNRHFHAPHDCAHHNDGHTDWQQAVLKIRTSNEEFYRCYRQAIEDMAALRLPIAGTDHMVFVPAAGLPWFMAPFGRDSLIVSLQNILIYPEFARGALDVLGRWQAKERDDYRDAEPGKIMHELRYGELAHFKLIPHTPYYGTADATPLYLITLHAAWRATGDRALLERHLDTAEGCLSWIDDWGDRDGDGFQEYQTRSPVGYENMSWKDAGDSMNYADGTPVKGPKAVCELQGYVYDAWLRMAEIYDELGRTDRAAALRDKAATLFRRFNDAFWDEESGFYAFMLDGEKRKVLSVASNPGHLLWSGIVPPDRAERVVSRLMAPDMSSGWGIRTLVGGPSGVQSVLVSERLGLAARQQPDRARFQTLRLRARGRPDRPRHLACGRPFPAQSVAGTLLRHAARRCRFPGAVPRRQRAAGLGRRLGVRVVAGDPWHHARRAARAHLRRSRAAGLAAGHHAVGPAARPAQHRHPLLARRCDHALRGAARSGADRRTAAVPSGRSTGLRQGKA